jgi:two-component system cell cycle sensor histidine kinase/response regulator CckA
MDHMKLLLIEDNPGDVRLLWEAVTEAWSQETMALVCDLEWVNCLSAGVQRLTQGGIDAVLLDLMLPDSEGLDTLVRVHQHTPAIPIIVLTSFGNETLGIKAVQVGAQDYLLKGQVDSRTLVHAIRHAIERQQMRQAFQASEARLRHLIVHNADGMLVVDREGIVCFANPAAEAMFGYPAGALVGAIFGLPMVAGDTTQLDVVHTHGMIAVAEMRVVETEWAGERAYLACLRDITARQQAEEVLHQRDEQLHQAQQMEAIGRLAGGVAHDFNNLLTAIIGYSDLLLMRLDSDNDLRRYVEQISKAANRATLLTSQLLACNRPQVVQPHVLCLNGVVTEMKKMLQPLIGEDVELTTILAPELGYIQVDRGHIQQLVTNLVVNARDAMPQGGRLHIETADVELTDTVATRYLGAPPGPYVMLVVRDTGKGMDEETRTHLFEPFFTTKEPGKGTGLGLAVVYGILQQNGGDIEVHSELGGGSTFKLYLPRVTAAILAPRLRDAPGVLLPGLETILLVEDEELVRVSIRDILQLHGYCVLEARDTTEALGLCMQHKGPIHLLVTDVVMPGLNGRELADRLLPTHPRMRVLFISGHADDAVGRYKVLDTSVAFLPKPFTPDALARKVRAVLDAADRGEVGGYSAVVSPVEAGLRPGYGT